MPPGASHAIRHIRRQFSHYAGIPLGGATVRVTAHAHQLRFEMRRHVYVLYSRVCLTVHLSGTVRYCSSAGYNEVV